MVHRFDDLISVNVVRAVLFLVASIGNGFIIYLILRSRKMRNEKFNLLIILLAIGDIVLGIGGAFRAGQQLIMQGKFTRLKCLAIGVPYIYGTHITQLAMLLIALDRIDTIFRLQKNHQKVFCLYILSIPFVLVASVIPAAMLFAGIDDRQADYCTIATNWNPRFGYFMFLETIIYSISILALYAVIFLLYHHKTKHLSNIPRNRFQSIVYGVIIVYTATWCIPKWIVFGLKTAKAETSCVAWFSVIAGIAELVSACLNVIIYGYSHRDLRKSMNEFCLKRFGYSIPVVKRSGARYVVKRNDNSTELEQ